MKIFSSLVTKSDIIKALEFTDFKLFHSWKKDRCPFCNFEPVNYRSWMMHLTTSHSRQHEIDILNTLYFLALNYGGSWGSFYDFVKFLVGVLNDPENFALKNEKNICN